MGRFVPLKFCLGTFCLCTLPLLVEDGVLPLLVEDGVLPLLVEDSVLPLLVEDGDLPLLVEDGVLPLLEEDGVLPLLVESVYSAEDELVVGDGPILAAHSYVARVRPTIKRRKENQR